MRELVADLRRWRARGERVALATVVATRRSAPRPVGSKVAVSSGGEVAGSVSGGCVESEVYEHARAVLSGGEPRLVTFGIADELALEMGLPCGGEIDVFVGMPEAEVLERLTAVVERGDTAATATIVDGDSAGEQVLVTDGEVTGAERLASFAQDGLAEGRPRVIESAEGTIFCDVFAPRARLIVVGAVDLAEALSGAARLLGWHTIVVDPRAKLATPERVPSAHELVVAWPDEAIARLAPDRSTAVVVLTHQERFDVPALRKALGSDAFYVGMLGSRRTQAKRRERLLEEGVAESDADRIAGPCGLDISAGTPAETAVSILAEIVAVRAGREGGRLRSSTERIHAEVA